MTRINSSNENFCYDSSVMFYNKHTSELKDSAASTNSNKV